MNTQSEHPCMAVVGAIYRSIGVLAAIGAALLFAEVSKAGQADNILGCVKKAQQFAGVTLNEFDASYVGNVLSPSEVRWPNAYCEAKVGAVYTLTVNDMNYIYKGYSGKASYDLYQTLNGRTQTAISQLESRIALLRERLTTVDAELSNPRPDHQKWTGYIDEGVAQALGKSVGAAVVLTPPVSSPRREVASTPAAGATAATMLAANESKAAKNDPPRNLPEPAAAQQRTATEVERDEDARIRLQLMSTGKSAVKMKLKDPSSASFRNVKVQKRDGMTVMCGEVNSKNSFGGYIGFQKFVSAGSSESTFLQEEVRDFATVWNRLCL